MGVALRDILSDYKNPAGWDKLSGKGAFDGNNALYQFLTTIRQPDGTPLMDREGRVTSHLSGMFFRVSNFLEKGMKPVFIFDGRPPDFKSDTIKERREAKEKAEIAYKRAVSVGDTQEAYKQARSATKVDAEIIESSKRLLSLMGIPVVDAPSEGEAQAAFMVINGDVSFTVSQDYDSLLFGAPKLVRNLTVSRKRKVRGRTITVNPEFILLPEVLFGLGITVENLIEMGILIGTDFNEGIRGVGAKTALKIVKNDNFDSFIKEKAPEFDPYPVKEFFLNPPCHRDYNLKWDKTDSDKLFEMLCEEYDFSHARVESVLDKLNEGAGQKTLDQWF
ncbi:flap endonuclease-1 [Methanoplanus sp. FWC-SCC4]|uniref:Flap endonuclease 1 n=1 Tax=Methanochimaera problematica TaxID=2609417 RepID=A0AA97FDI3_9EURY|nr:flap endonuclease-1 [Methanoplanus sp. FWC-SCC4]WOF16547.1 flap endonuclease-1 [Methanoplanus sp. FWC-SCC4]